jgi:hypothetical protein
MGPRPQSTASRASSIAPASSPGQARRRAPRLTALASPIGVAIVVAALALLSIAQPLRGANLTRLFRDDKMHVRAFEAPADWEPAKQASYPHLLVAYTYRYTARITLAAEHVAAGTTAADMATRGRSPLERQGFRGVVIVSDGNDVRLDAKLDRGARFIKQLYRVQNNIAYVVTLLAPQADAPEMSRAFEEALRSLVIDGGEAVPDGGIPR